MGETHRLKTCAQARSRHTSTRPPGSPRAGSHRSVGRGPAITAPDGGQRSRGDARATQRPSVQSASAPHALLQAPQCARSSRIAAQRAPQRTWSGGHAHLPHAQCSPSPHTTSQPPQRSAARVSVHSGVRVASQRPKPGRHRNPHRPAAVHTALALRPVGHRETSPGSHETAFGSSWTSPGQAPSHTHMPPWHVVPAMQRRPQAPQCSDELARGTAQARAPVAQVPDPTGHGVVHSPQTHRCPASHARSHPPQ